MGDGWLYLAVVLALYSRSVVAWFPGERITRELMIQALTIAIWRRRHKAGLIPHSNRGSQYASNDYPRLWKRHGFLCSMSGKGDCYDNAAMESFFPSLKVEQTEGKRYVTREEAKADVFEYIESYCNRQRRHSTLDYLSPCDFRSSNRRSMKIGVHKRVARLICRMRRKGNIRTRCGNGVGSTCFRHGTGRSIPVRSSGITWTSSLCSGRFTLRGIERDENPVSTTDLRLVFNLGSSENPGDQEF
jgi:hypothetical protein